MDAKETDPISFVDKKLTEWKLAEYSQVFKGKQLFKLLERKCFIVFIVNRRHNTTALLNVAIPLFLNEYECMPKHILFIISMTTGRS